MISFKDAVKNGFKKTFVYRSRASRAEFWWFMLFIALCYGVLLIMFALLGLLLSSYMFTHEAEKVIEEVSLPISYIFVLSFTLPILSLTIRRLHDSDSSAWYLLCVIVGCNIFSAVVKAVEYESSILGALLLFVFSLPVLLLSIIPSTPGINKYGMNPAECNYSSGLDKRKVKKYVNPINCIKNGFVNIFKFSGRATRTEFWWFALFYSIFLTVSILVMKEVKLLQIPIIICNIVTTIAFISLFIRRIHDSNHSGWYLLLGFLGAPYYLCLIEGDIDDNDYGPSPYETTELEVQKSTEDLIKIGPDKVSVAAELKQFEKSDHRRYMPGYVEDKHASELAKEKGEQSDL